MNQNIIEYSNCQFYKKRIIVSLLIISFFIIGLVLFGVGWGCNISYECSFIGQGLLIFIGSILLLSSFTVLSISLYIIYRDYRYKTDPQFKEKIDNKAIQKQIKNKLEGKNNEQLSNINNFIDSIV